MATFLLVQGIEPVELAESFTLVRRRLNSARKTVIDYENGNIDGQSDGQRFEPFHELSFKTVQEDSEEPGRISVNIERIIGVGSDQAKDSGE